MPGLHSRESEVRHQILALEVTQCAASMENLRSRLALRQVLASDSQHHSGEDAQENWNFCLHFQKGDRIRIPGARAQEFAYAQLSLKYVGLVKL